jgi:hypothetical protein
MGSMIEEVSSVILILDVEVGNLLSAPGKVVGSITADEIAFTEVAIVVLD